MIGSQRLPVIELNEVFRQAMESMIITNAHAIVAGEMPDLSIATDINKVEININGYKYEYLGNKRNGTNDTEIFNAIVKAGDKYI